MGDGRFMCTACGNRASVTAGTILDRTRTPLTVWFAACWNFASGKDGISALSLKRTLEIGSYQTAWAMLHRLRSVLVRPDRELLHGTVEVDETYIGGIDPGLAGGRARGKKVLTCIAVEILEPKGYGRCRMVPVADASAESLMAFVAANVEPGATVITDAWQSYRGLENKGYTSMTDVVNGQPVRVAKTRARCCQACIGSRHWQNAGCSARTRARSTPRTCPVTSMSLCSGLTAGTHAVAGCCSTGCWSSQSLTTPCATKTLLGGKAPRPNGPSRR